MQHLEYSTEKKSKTSIFFSIDNSPLSEITATRNTAIISSRNLVDAYPSIFKGKKPIVIDDTESHKNLATIEKIIAELLELGTDRNSYIIGIGGGIVCDITGFVSHIYMRGVRFGLVPTTLLAMTDASIGGKNGVNFNENKNFIGSFDNPDFIIADSKFLHTLPEKQYLSGLGEIIKYALIGNSNILNILETNPDKILNRNSETIQKLVSESVLTKIKIVEKDPDDKSIRHILNFGHTIGHSIELLEDIPHGLAVVKGMNAATDISVKLGILATDKAQQIKQLLTSFGYDISYKLGENHIRLLSNDKKKEDSNIRIVLLEDIGKPQIRKMPVQQIIDLAR
ncbi:MAG: 3-dehydroquinate synthase [Bacteroidales bacterium]|nr:3-dehydroquinate synthase [Bacteroidales bacterium]